jgi:predicted permease
VIPTLAAFLAANAATAVFLFLLPSWQNSLVWSTGVSLLLSYVGSSSVLDPDQPTAWPQVAFVEGLLGWFAQTTAPLTLFTTGLWMQSTSSSSSVTAVNGSSGSSGAVGAIGASSGIEEAVDGPLSSRQMCLYLLLRCTVAPAMMVLLCRLLRVSGDLAHALVILALLPVAQTAFVVCKQYDVGTHVVSMVMVASLFLMLPQLMAVLALLEGLGILGP